MTTNLDLVQSICTDDCKVLREKGVHYGDSWKKRGGVGAFMMLARKWDRLENYMEKNGYDIFKLGEEDSRDESVLDDIQDLRRYLLLVESEILLRKIFASGPKIREDSTGQKYPFGFNPGEDRV